MRRLAFFAAAAALSLAAWSAPGDLEIRSVAGGEEIVLRTSARFAGAVSSIVYRGVEYIDIADHGREMQSASSFDGLGECYNPTEAGNRDDGNGARSSSRLIAARAGDGWLETETDMAFWLRPGTDYRQACGTRPEVRQAANTAERAGHLLRKRVAFVEGIPNLIEYDATYIVPEGHASATFEIVTGYMPPRFAAHWRYRLRSGELDPASGQGERAQPVILATADDRHAMGVWSPHMPRRGAGYGRFEFPGVGKWNCVVREQEIRAGAEYRYRCYVAVGTTAEVKSALQQAATRFGTN